MVVYNEGSGLLYYQKLKFPSDEGVVEVRGSQ